MSEKNFPNVWSIKLKNSFLREVLKTSPLESFKKGLGRIFRVRFSCQLHYAKSDYTCTQVTKSREQWDIGREMEYMVIAFSTSNFCGWNKSLKLTLEALAV